MKVMILPNQINKETFDAWILSRNQLYRAFSKVFLKSISDNEDTIHALYKTLCDFWCLDSGRVDEFKELEDLKEVVKNLEPLLKSGIKTEYLKEVYENHFDGPWGDLVSPYASVYIGEKDVLMNSTTAIVGNYYEAVGYEVLKSECKPLDHIGEILKSMTVLECDPIDDAVVIKTLQLQGEFLDALLCPFAMAFSTALMNQATLDFYRQLGNVLSQFVAKDLEIIQSILRVQAEESTFNRLVTQDLEKGVYEDSKMKTVIVSGINNCGGACSLRATVIQGNVTHIDTNDALSGGAIKACMRGHLYRQSFLSPKRLKYPMKRVGKRGEGKFIRITWEEAIDLMANELTRIKSSYGPEARYVNYGTGNTALFNGGSQAKRLLALDGGYLNYHNSYSTACISGATPYTFGDRFTGHSPDDYKNAKLIVLWGHNPAATMFGSDNIRYLKEAKAAGAKIIVIDPRKNETAMMIADQWIPLRPTTDSAFIAAVSKVIFDRNLQDQDFMDQFCLGFDDHHMPETYKDQETYRAYVYGERDGIVKSLSWASKITGVPESVIESFAIEFASSKPAALIQGYGPQRNANGEQIVRSCNLLTCLTGNVGISGGSAGGGAYLGYPLPSLLPEIQNPVKASIPCFLWTDAVLDARAMTPEGHGIQNTDALSQNIKFIFNLAGNMLVNQHSDINRTEAILKDESKVEFIVTSDLFMTPSAKFSDLVLPGASMFETENIKAPWIGGSYLLYLNQCIDPIFESKIEYDWLVDLSERLGVKEAFTNGKDTLVERLKEVYDAYANSMLNIPQAIDLPSFVDFQNQGGVIFKEPITTIAYQDQRLDLLGHPFKTPSGKIEIFSPRLYEMNQPDQIPAIPKYVAAFEGPEDLTCHDLPFQLVGWHTKRRTHSTHDLNARLERTEPQRLWVNSVDAHNLDLINGDWVTVYNDRGRVLIQVLVTDRIMKGVVGMSQGRWVFKNQLGEDVNGSINMLTTSRPTPLIKGNPQHSNRVNVVKVKKV